MQALDPDVGSVMVAADLRSYGQKKKLSTTLLRLHAGGVAVTAGLERCQKDRHPRRFAVDQLE